MLWFQWLRQLLSDLYVPKTTYVPLYCDSQTTLHITTNPVYHERTKHIEVDFHFVCDEYQTNRVSLHYVPTLSQLADIFTKALGSSHFTGLLRKLGIRDLHTLTWGESVRNSTIYSTFYMYIVSIGINCDECDLAFSPFWLVTRIVPRISLLSKCMQVYSRIYWQIILWTPVHLARCTQLVKLCSFD